MHSGLLNSFGLEVIAEDEGLLRGFITLALENGIFSKTYYGPKHLNYYFKVKLKDGSIGDDSLQLICNFEESDEGRFDLASFDVHDTGDVVWDIEVLFECKDEKKTYTGQRQIVCKTINGEGGLAVVNVLNPDVLPSYLPNDKIKLQMKAVALDIDYFNNDDEFDKNFQSEYKLGMGTVISSQFIYNHQLSPKGKPLDREVNYEENDYTLIRGTVKSIKVYPIVFEDGKELCSFINVRVDTQYGELDIIHSFNQIKEEQRYNLFVGSQVFATCVLQGDAFLYDRDITLNKENNLRALNFALNSGETNRIKNILTNDVEYVSNSTNKNIKGKKELIDYLEYVHNNQNQSVKRYISSNNNDNEVIRIEYDNLSPQIMKIECNDEGLINRIYVQDC